MGLLISNTVAVIDDDRLLALDADTGQVRWSRPLSSSVRTAVVDETRTTIYLTTISDTLQAIDAAGRSRWQIPLTATRPIGFAALTGRWRHCARWPIALIGYLG